METAYHLATIHPVMTEWMYAFSLGPVTDFLVRVYPNRGGRRSWKGAKVVS